MSEYSPKQCHGCAHYEDNYDPSVGMFGQPQCCAVDFGTEDFNDNEEALAVVLEKVLFALSDINNCPMWKAKEVRQRSILQVKRPEPGDDNYMPFQIDDEPAF